MESKKNERYERLVKQVDELFTKSNDPLARMATLVAVLHHKIEYFFWTGFYFLKDDGKLIVGPYQGSLACLELKKHEGVCWTAVLNKEVIIVQNVHEFPGHIACDARSKSEIALPFYNNEGVLIGVFDVDSKELNSFDETDANYLKLLLEKVFTL